MHLASFAPVAPSRAASVPLTTSTLALTALAARVTSAAFATAATLVPARAAAATPPATIASDGAVAAYSNPRDRR